MSINFKQILTEIYQFKLSNPSETEEKEYLNKIFKGKYLYIHTLPKMEKFGTSTEDVFNITNVYVSNSIDSKQNSDKNDQTETPGYKLVLEGHIFHVGSRIDTSSVTLATYNSFQDMVYILPDDCKSTPNDELFETLLVTREKFDEIKNKTIKKIEEENTIE